MALIRRDPWSSMTRLHDEINRLLQERYARGGDGDASDIATSHWAPAVDIKEENDRFVITADIPGVAPEQIEITMDNGVLALRGARKEERKEERDGYKRVERVSGTFYRRFALPDGVDPQGITAKGQHGVLEIAIPKVERAKARRIEVTT